MLNVLRFIGGGGGGGFLERLGGGGGGGPARLPPETPLCKVVVLPTRDEMLPYDVVGDSGSSSHDRSGLLLLTADSSEASGGKCSGLVLIRWNGRNGARACGFASPTGSLGIRLGRTPPMGVWLRDAAGGAPPDGVRGARVDAHACESGCSRRVGSGMTAAVLPARTDEPGRDAIGGREGRESYGVPSV